MKSNDRPKETVNNQTHRNVISSFTGKYAFLSNFYPAPVTYMGQTYANKQRSRFPGTEDLLCKRTAAILYLPPAQSGGSQKAGKETHAAPGLE